MATAPELLSDADLEEFLDELNETEGPTCPHCDALFPHSMANNWCSCAGCDACDRQRQAVRYIAAVEAEYRRRHPRPLIAVSAAPAADEPF